ncbi:DUF2605 domain-containing protein [Synechococcus elongatus]|uniref:DUF2605 domain-containing protein n=2 Tax=Synechococcus elongatus TaxID=32046 RepID=Q31M52_SYNE7|nr:DUF2605 domain-containing protein [Synechococcus elongatus]MBD2687657.1 DUF2605 domain-containing protein [Synechococcus elongatus FACHB-1061]ABB57867.1 conserved hypothetical protein [Synechococcus elongatus PCC 7942 = FACHB-805]AJD57650.1 hypothetical protein M744_07285 [Synechococcus elongatus UTEX 2973]MBD2586583.1 DUF2605 domain-containing protein [Synechococcus elongatus FACHB-242]MBD2706634.1 DUF2605 domain-containing protein [Synechococcus elongatus PCC 7942 = FACHB-805]
MTLPELPAQPELLKAILEPLLDDFLFWFDRAEQLLTKESIDFLTPEEQAALCNRLAVATAEVRSTQALFKAMDGSIGIEVAVMKPWHALVTECWQIGARWRREQAQQLPPETSQ